MKKLLIFSLLLSLLAISHAKADQGKVWITLESEGAGQDALFELDSILTAHNYTPNYSSYGANYYMTLNGPAGNPCDVTVSIVSFGKNQTVLATGHGTCKRVFPEGVATVKFPSAVFDGTRGLTASGQFSPKALKRAFSDLGQNLK